MGHALLIVIVEPDTPPEAIEQRVQELMEPYDQESDAVGRESSALPCEGIESGSGAADSDCEERSGTGSVPITYNPQETFDWYEPGGRWDGEIRGEATVARRWSDLVPDDIRRNMVLVREVPAGFVPCAIHTPDGNWHGGGADAEKDGGAWTVEQANILRKYPEYLAISVDFDC